MNLQVKIHLDSFGFILMGFFQKFYVFLEHFQKYIDTFQDFSQDCFRVSLRHISWQFLFQLLLEILPDSCRHFYSYEQLFPGFSLENFPGFPNSDRFLMDFFSRILQNFFPELLPKRFPALLPEYLEGFFRSSSCVFPKNFLWIFYQDSQMFSRNFS